MEFTYKPHSICPTEIRFRLEGNRVFDIRFSGGCNGNLKMLSKLLDGWTVDEIEARLSGNVCGRRPTSCADQLALAVRQGFNALVKKI